MHDTHDEATQQSHPRHASQKILLEMGKDNKDKSMIAYHETMNIVKKNIPNAIVPPLKEWNPYETEALCKKHHIEIPKSLSTWLKIVATQFVEECFKNITSADLTTILQKIQTQYNSSSFADQQAREYIQKTYEKQQEIPKKTRKTITDKRKALLTNRYTTRNNDDVMTIVEKEIHHEIQKHFQEQGIFLDKDTLTSAPVNIFLDTMWTYVDQKTKKKCAVAYSDVYKTLVQTTIQNPENKDALEAKNAFEKTSFEQKNPYLLINQLMEFKEPIPASLWSWIKLLEKTFLNTMRDEEVVAKQETIKTHLLEKF